MLPSDKHTFDWLNKYTYLFRLVSNQNGLSVDVQHLANDQTAYHLVYRDAVLCSIAIQEDDINIRIFKYFRVACPKLKDAEFSEFFKSDGSAFDFDKYSAYCTTLKTAYDGLDDSVAETPTTRVEHSSVGMDLQDRYDDTMRHLWSLWLSLK